MSTIFRSMVGAAALVAASAMSVSAQDYTWTLENFRFGDYFDPSTSPLPTYVGTESFSTASGTLVLSRTGTNSTGGGVYALKSYNFTTTSDGFGGTGFAATYDSVNITPLYGTDELPAPEFDSFIEMRGESADRTEFAFHLSWENAGLASEMDGNFGAGNLNAAVALDGLNSYEFDLDGNFVRYNDDANSFNNTAINPFPGQLRLTAIPDPIATPEPASLALLGTGLLGIFAARRRKRA